MAKLGLQPILDSHWMKASELHLHRQEYRRAPLELTRLKSFFPFGLQRGSLIELIGSKSSGRTSTSLYILAESISKGETCAYVDLNDQFDPASLAQTSVTLNQLAWVRCQGNAEHAMRSADLLVHAGGFGIVLLDLCGASPQVLNKIPLSYWFRFQRAIEDTPTILLICGEYSQARSCSRNSLQMHSLKVHWAGKGSSTLLKALELRITPRSAAQTKVMPIRPEYLFIPTPIIQTSEV